VYHATNFKFFDRYQQEPVVLMDDFRKDKVDFSFFLQLIDRYLPRVEKKGVDGGCFWNPRVIIITCPRLPDAEFVAHSKDSFNNRVTDVYEDVDQVWRRCDEVWEYVK